MNLASLLKDIYWGEHFSAAHPNPLSPNDVSALLALAVQHKVLPYLLGYFDHHGIGYSLTEDQTTLLAKFEKERQSWTTFLDSLSGNKVVTGNFVVLKGIAFETLYADQRQRFCLDMDLVLSDSNVFWEIMEVALDRGFVMPGMFQLFRGQHDDKLEGIARFGFDYDHLVGGIETHLRRFQITPTTFLHWSTLSHFDTVATAVDGTEFFRPNWAVSFIVYLAEMVSRENVCIRDAYDAEKLLTREYSDDEVALISRTLADLGLSPVLTGLLEFYREFDSPAPELLTTLHQDNQTVAAGQSPVGFHTQKFYSDYGFLRRTKYRLIYWLRDTMDRLVARDRMLRAMRWTDHARITNWMFAFGFPIFCLLLEPEEPTTQTQGQKVVDRFSVRSSGKLHYLFAANAIVTDEELELIEQSI